MKRMMLVCLMILCLVPMGSWAEETIEWYDRDNEVYNSRGEHFLYEVVEDHAVLIYY